MKENSKKKKSNKRVQSVSHLSDAVPDTEAYFYSSILENEKLIRFFIFTSLIIFIIVGLLLRVLNAGQLSFWYDEFVHVIRARDVVQNDGPLFTNDNNGILLTIVMIPLFMLLGVSEWVARFPSALFSTASVYLVYLLGKQLFGRFVGWTAAAISVVSIYLIYWGRIARNYSIFEFFYLLLLYFLIRALQPQVPGSPFWMRWKLNRNYFFLFVITFLLALSAHQLIFIFFIALCIYLIGKSLVSIFTNQQDRFSNIYFFAGLFSVSVLCFLFIPFLQPVAASLFKTVVYENLQQFVIPNWANISELWNSKFRWESFSVYFNVLEHDLPLLYPCAIAGVLFSFFINKSSGWLLFCFSAVPFPLLSFVYRDPCDPRYMIFFYPLMLISVACFFYFFSFFLFGKVIKKNWSTGMIVSVCLLFMILIVWQIPYTNLFSLIKAEKKTGYLIDKALSKWTFVDWRNDLSYVKSNLKKEDIVMSTNPIPVAYYLGRDSVSQFRQRKLNRVTKEYEDLPTTDTSGYSAHSLTEVMATFNKNKRGWMIADYNLLTVFTEAEARNFVWKNMTFHHDATRTGTVQIFSWDHSTPISYDAAFVFEMGKHELAMGSETILLNFTEVPEGGVPYLVLLLEGLDRDNEGYLLINKKYRVLLPANTQRGPQVQELELPYSYVQQGVNTFTFYYNRASIDRTPGYVAYNLEGGFKDVESDAQK